ncbi:unnamed protein product [Paramecium pentaurelia]|uniref:RNA helicase n=1 Tax=Paramecium pentaurelia TaxID=43138 RepID=A0A8S1YGG5_9CILI|nr:unnamed protein product [Paramecium pentaurelia]
MHQQQQQQDEQKRSLVQEKMQMKQQGIDNGNMRKINDEDIQKIQAYEQMQIENAMKNSTWSTLMLLKSKEIVKSRWRPKKKQRLWDQYKIDKILKKYSIMIEGNDPPPPIKSFQDLRVDDRILKILSKMKIKKPTPIQMQGLPAVLMGRDIIGVAPSGQGKTLVFLLPALLQCVDEQMKMPIIRGEGPFALILLPSHELAILTYELAKQYCHKFQKKGFPEIHCLLGIGGMDMSSQLQSIKNGVHIVIGTPGRISDMVNKKKINMDLCRFIVLDEADRMLDQVFELEIRNILEHFTGPRQTMLFSATLPKKIQEFTKQTLVDPLVINVGRSGQINLNVIQEILYVKQEEKLHYLLDSLKKTTPPVVIFSEHQNDVDDINEYLLIKGVEVVGLHGGKQQEDRTKALKQFLNGQKDVLVATDVAAKGLDFPDIKHVINYDMPKDIESYIHRIGRTGRQGKTGRATTFVNRQQEESILLDLKYLLVESKQKIPQFLEKLKSDEDLNGSCGYCDGMGHRMANCPKLEKQKMRILTNPNKESCPDFLKGQNYRESQSAERENQMG